MFCPIVTMKTLSSNSPLSRVQKLLPHLRISNGGWRRISRVQSCAKLHVRGWNGQTFPGDLRKFFPNTSTPRESAATVRTPYIVQSRSLTEAIDRIEHQPNTTISPATRGFYTFYIFSALYETLRSTSSDSWQSIGVTAPGWKRTKLWPSALVQWIVADMKFMTRGRWHFWKTSRIGVNDAGPGQFSDRMQSTEFMAFQKAISTTNFAVPKSWTFGTITQISC